MTQKQPPQHDDDVIVARAGTYYRNARYIMTFILVAMGLWFLWDGFVTYPNSNKVYDNLTRKIDDFTHQGKQDAPECRSLVERRKIMTYHEPFGIRVQRILGFSLPPLAIGLLIHWLRVSRGEFRFENDVLYAPGHPPVPLSQIEDLDKLFWERKGIAFAGYKLQDGTVGRLRLDDFVYQAKPIREMVAIIEEELRIHDATQQQPPINIPPRPNSSNNKDQA